MPEKGKQFYNENTPAAKAKSDAMRDMLAVDGREHRGISDSAVGIRAHHSKDVYNISCVDCKQDAKEGTHPLKRPKRG